MVEINNRTKSKIDLRLVRQVAEKFLQQNKKTAKGLSLAFVGDKEIKDLNYKYRKINKPTDVLSFSGEGDFLGEVIIDYAQIKRQASIFNNTVKKELVFILTHGLLHLLGHQDETEVKRKKMIALGDKFIKKFFNSI